MFVGHMERVAVEGDTPAPAFGVGGVDPEKEGVAGRKSSSQQLRAFGSDVDHKLNVI